MPLSRATHAKHVRHEPCGRAVGVTRGKPELDAVVSQDGVDLRGHGRDEGRGEGRGSDAVGFVHQLDEGELAGPVDGNEEVELSFGGLQLGDVDVEEADWIGFERLLDGLLTLDVRQTTDPVALPATMQ